MDPNTNQENTHIDVDVPDQARSTRQKDPRPVVLDHSTPDKEAFAKKYQVNDLKAYLRATKWPTSSKKADLVNRIWAHLNYPHANAVESADSDSGSDEETEADGVVKVPKAVKKGPPEIRAFYELCKNTDKDVGQGADLLAIVLLLEGMSGNDIIEHLLNHASSESLTISNNMARSGSRAFKRGYANSVDGRIWEGTVHMTVLSEDGQFLIKANVGASMLSDSYVAYLKFTVNPIQILIGYCTCQAGIMGTCSHACGLAWWLVQARKAYEDMGEEVFCSTSIAQAWGRPSTCTPYSAKDLAKPIDEMPFQRLGKQHDGRQRRGWVRIDPDWDPRPPCLQQAPSREAIALVLQLIEMLDPKGCKTTAGPYFLS
ncbi:hypothetical protein AMAG_00128 [Allomyces macrogynus ATCC 38327]|uniref:SWIM-type domain-containing protein n=1 Tax=Allomyces macrogynus (strain ATCC 38327) TaxID=578462 RepID=A0A0L0RVM2_ALLM3|nr:hypothetical protein AMAG_00128 [Allomyces macrogynus ATCC 38327]|eukprot:KNE54126.1 hypothetical protein AMAG_00128 [Allomyces macrogynus ATCC 38327]